MFIVLNFDVGVLVKNILNLIVSQVTTRVCAFSRLRGTRKFTAGLRARGILKRKAAAVETNSKGYLGGRDVDTPEKFRCQLNLSEISVRLNYVATDNQSAIKLHKNNQLPSWGRRGSCKTGLTEKRATMHLHGVITIPETMDIIAHL